MATAGPRLPGTGATYANAGTSENAEAWVNPGNITVDDGTIAAITAPTYDSPDISEILVGSNFGFSAEIPAGSTINGITVVVERNNAAGAASDNRIQLGTAANFAGLVGDNKADTVTDWPAALGTATYGGAADHWNAGLTAAQVNAAGFSVHVSAQADAANTDVGVDRISVTIDYTPPAPSGTGDIIVPAATVVGSGSLILTGTGAITVPSATVAGVGEEVFTATGAITVPAATVAGVGEEVFTATGAIVAEPPLVAGVGNHSEGAPPAPEGTGAISVPAATVSGSGQLILTGTGAITIPAATVAALGSEVFTGTGAISVPTATVSGSGTHGTAGTPLEGGPRALVHGAPIMPRGTVGPTTRGV